MIVQTRSAPSSHSLGSALPRNRASLVPDPSPQEDPADTVLFVLNSAGETNMARPIIEELKDQGTETKVLHFRHNSKSILTEQGVLEDEDFVDGTNSFNLPSLGQAFQHPERIKTLVGTPHHVYSQLAFSKAKKLGIPVIAAVDLGIPPTKFRFRHSFYRALSFADQIVVPDESVKNRLKNRIKDCGYEIDPSKIRLGGNPGFESFRREVDSHRSKADDYRNALGIEEKDLVLAFSSQPTPLNGAVLHLLGEAVQELARRQPDRDIHVIFSPHARDLQDVGWKNLFGTETSLSVPQKLQILQDDLGDLKQVHIHEFGNTEMKKATALADVVVTESSTTAYEAAHSEVPAIFLRTPQHGMGTTFPAFKGVPVVNSPTGFADAVEASKEISTKDVAHSLSQVVGTDVSPYLALITGTDFQTKRTLS